MAGRKVAPYGSWESPITTELITAGTISFMENAVDGEDIYWSESRPMEGGRYVIMRRTADGKIIECTPQDFNARSTVHEYGGGAWLVADGVIYFTNFKDQHLYRQPLGGKPELLTPGDGYRYADMIMDDRRKRLICVREDHTSEGEAINTIVGVSLTGNDNGQVLLQGNNFYSNPRLNPDGSKLAYLTWNHPNMPWDGTELWVADVEADGTLGKREQAAGGKGESIFQPSWSPDGILYFVSDRTDWWNLYRWIDSKAEALSPMDAEFGEPQWQFDSSTYSFISPTEIICAYTHEGTWDLARLDTRTKELAQIASSFTYISDVRAGKGFATFMAGSPKEPMAIIRLDAATGKMEALKHAFDVTVDARYFSIPRAVTFPTADKKKAHGFYYTPQSLDYTAPRGERPPLLVLSHGGPTSATTTVLRYNIQFWTSRGFAVLDVDYGGSTGHGRAYRERLNNNWGIVDVDDCCNGALYLVEKGWVDGKRLAIRGGSAGGYTTLAALTFKKVFQAGASHFGISDLEVFVHDTHKFESRYLESLVGPYPARREIYRERSPINYTDQLSTPMILFQGDEDKIVPPNQSQMIFDAVRAKGIPVAYVLFQGEQHGFRKAENIKRSYEDELYFYSRVFKFEPAEPLVTVHIENL
jgi:dipeptidyl aminopeptidase/acylaminoacyl peptidase